MLADLSVLLAHMTEGAFSLDVGFGALKPGLTNTNPRPKSCSSC